MIKHVEHVNSRTTTLLKRCKIKMHLDETHCPNVEKQLVLFTLLIASSNVQIRVVLMSYVNELGHSLVGLS